VSQVFCALLFLSALFFALAFFVGLPMITLRPQKCKFQITCHPFKILLLHSHSPAFRFCSVALSFTMGSLTFMGSFGILKGPKEHLMSMFEAERLYFTFIYLGSMMATLYFTFSFGGASGYVLVISASAAQLVALIWYLVSFLPGGSAGLHYVGAAMGHVLKPVVVACAKLQAACISRLCSWLTSGGGSSSTS